MTAREEEAPSAGLRAVSAALLILLCTVLWHAAVRPTLLSRTTTIAIPSEPLSLAGLNVMGSDNAPVALVVFSDFECPVCGTFAREVLPSLVDKYVAPGNVIVAFSDLPLETIHPSAFRRAAIAECAGRQGRFWDVHDRFFRAQDGALMEQEAMYGLNEPAFKVCLSSVEPVIRQRLATATALGVRSTPSVMIGVRLGNRVTVTDAVAGLQSVRQLEAMLDRRLTK